MDQITLQSPKGVVLHSIFHWLLASGQEQTFACAGESGVSPGMAICCPMPFYSRRGSMTRYRKGKVKMKKKNKKNVEIIQEPITSGEG